MGTKRVRVVKTRGGNLKYRALRLDAGNFCWGSENCTRKVRILDVVYNSSNNELVRTKTLVKNAIVQVDANLFKQWYKQHYHIDLGRKDNKRPSQDSKSLEDKVAVRNRTRKIDMAIADQFSNGRLLACISSRPGQSGRCDGYILEGDELNFYTRKLTSKKKAKA